MSAKGRRAHHDERALMIVGTKKGVFVYESDFDREKWKRTGPYLPDQPIHSLAYDYRDRKSVFIASGGAGLHRTRDFGRTWEKVGKGLPSEKLTHVAIGHLSEAGSIWVGLENGAIAKSRDGGDSFEELTGFRAIPSAAEWWGRAGAPIVTSIIVHADSPKHVHVGVSVGGVFKTEDGGTTWESCNEGIAPSYPEKYQAADAHRDVYCLASNPAKPERLYAVAHSGVYRTDDDGATWKDVTKGLPSRSTRAIIVSPSKPGTVFVVPLKDSKEPMPNVDGALSVFRSTDAGETWTRVAEGLPERVNATVHREAMRMDTLDEEGLYVATSDGHIFVSLDEGETWTQIVSGLTQVHSVEVITEQE